MSMKVCKLVRLTQKDDKGRFIKGEGGARVTVRSRTVVSQQTVEESVANCKKTGMLYVVDEKATAERDAIVEAENEAAKVGKSLEEIEVVDAKNAANDEDNDVIDLKARDAAEDFKEKVVDKKADAKNDKL